MNYIDLWKTKNNIKCSQGFSDEEVDEAKKTEVELFTYGYQGLPPEYGSPLFLMANSQSHKCLNKVVNNLFLKQAPDSDIPKKYIQTLESNTSGLLNSDYEKQKLIETIMVYPEASQKEFEKLNVSFLSAEQSQKYLDKIALLRRVYIKSWLCGSCHITIFNSITFAYCLLTSTLSFVRLYPHH